MDDWVKRTLGEICDEVGGIIKTGPFGSQLHQSDYTETGIPVVMPKNIVDDKISIADIAYISSEDAERLAQHRMLVGDIVYGRRGDIGRQALITARENGWLCGTGSLRISLGDTVILPIFLHYYLMQADVIDWIYNQAIGATMANLNTNILRSVPVYYPPLETQRRIAEVLSAYDDLIENNNQRIKALEQAAQDLYHEWFVEFRYPNHEAVPLVDSGTDYGMIPQGWEILTVENILSYHIGGGWGKDEPESDDNIEVHIIRGTDIPDGRKVRLPNVPRRFVRPSELNSRELEIGDIIFEVSGGSKDQPVGRALLITEHILNAFDTPVMCASFCKLLRLNLETLHPIMFYLHLQKIYENRTIMKYQVQSTGITNFKFAHFLSSEYIVIPPVRLKDIFIDVSETIFDEIGVLGAKNRYLREARDLLLPRLVSGELAVDDVELVEGDE